MQNLDKPINRNLDNYQQLISFDGRLNLTSVMASRLTDTHFKCIHPL